MTEMLTCGITKIQQISADLNGFCLLIPCLFILLFYERERAEKKGLDPLSMRLYGWLALLALLICAAPVSSYILYRLIPDESAVSLYFLAVPTAVTAAYTATLLLSSAKKEKKSERRILMAGIFIVALASISLPWHFSTDGFSLTQNAQKIDPDTIAVCREIGSEKALLPSTILAELGEFDNDADPVTDVSYHEKSSIATARTGERSACQYIVMRVKYNTDPECFIERGYKEVKKAGAYVIYKKKS